MPCSTLFLLAEKSIPSIVLRPVTPHGAGDGSAMIFAGRPQTVCPGGKHPLPALHRPDILVSRGGLMSSRWSPDRASLLRAGA